MRGGARRGVNDGANVASKMSARGVRRQVHLEAGRGQTPAQLGRGVRRRQAGAWRGQPPECLAGAFVPRPSVRGGLGTVEEERIDVGDEFGQAPADVGEHEQQLHLALVEAQAMQVRRQRRPCGVQCVGQLSPWRIAVHVDQIGAPGRIGLDRDEDQRRAALRVDAPGVPGGEKAVACAESGLEHDEAVPPLPALRQLVALDERAEPAGQRGRHRA